MTKRKTIQEWFHQNQYCGLVLPDGWYGKPYDEMHRLASVSEEDDIMVIVLDESMRLRFRLADDIHVSGDDLIIGRFEELLFISGSDVRTYSAGMVVLKCFLNY